MFAIIKLFQIKVFISNELYVSQRFGLSECQYFGTTQYRCRLNVEKLCMYLL